MKHFNCPFCRVVININCINKIYLNNYTCEICNDEENNDNLYSYTCGHVSCKKCITYFMNKYDNTMVNTLNIIPKKILQCSNCLLYHNKSYFTRKQWRKENERLCKGCL